MSGSAARGLEAGARSKLATPPGFRRVEQGDAIAIVREDLWPALAEAGLLESGAALDGRAGEDSYQGRGSTAIVRVAGERWVVRRFLPGGLLRHVRPATFAAPERAFRELALYAHLRSRGFRTLDPIAAIARRSGARWILHLVTRHLEEARELLELLLDRSAPRRLRRAALAEAGRSVRALHDEGVRHADLHLKNLLWSRGAVFVIDLDRSRLEVVLSRAARVANLERLWRFARRRLEASLGARALARDAVRFLRAYEPERALRRALTIDAARAEMRSRWRHGLGRWCDAKLAWLRALGRGSLGRARG